MWLSLTDGRRFAFRVLATALLLSLLVAAGIVLAPSAAAQSGGTIVFQTVSGGPVYAVDADGSSLRYLTSGMDPALSPDGQHVAFTRWEGPGHGAFGSLWVINIDGSGERMVLSNVRQPKSPVWSPDGRQIAISTQEGGRLQPESKCGRGLPSEPLLADADGDYFRVVVEVDSDGDVETKLCYTLLPHPFWGLRVVDVATGAFEDLPGDRFSYAPTWDPANDWHLVYDGERGLVNLDLTRNEGATWPLTDDPNDHAPVFSPDGSQIAVSYWQHDHWDIHLMMADGSGRVRLTETPLRAIVEARIKGEEGRAWNNVAPAWSPDGSQIAFLTDRTGRWEIWVMQADGSNQRPLLPHDTLDQLGIGYDSVDERVLSWK
jgi:dipeptidyl aminopeptidase/acylaminoacyl peptidase